MAPPLYVEPRLTEPVCDALTRLITVGMKMPEIVEGDHELLVQGLGCITVAVDARRTQDERTDYR